ncbi:filamentous hemagglutinin N-terminal domain-containing protein [Aulosira sp. FACHB-615]|uniref:filamentous hemagglutinin N-terminal domain-containing protein n=1 Tax=Aulosira sp. FACHB-615 TaxID=2692777 RepID=UPI0016880D51|nr:filamentous hemagglutinin N-terminal domain-containing protein [Aulosira sp. FACHB-615]MBD2486306.1 filamentous hemagglutinin N-terminal domain-containing protein [Aulosira sp. FACHB-615]
MSFWIWFTGIGLTLFGAIAFSSNSAIAQISADDTLPNNSVVRLQGNTIFIEGGTRVQSNLFHSFKQFSIGENTTAEFTNIDNVQNIISRVTGNSISRIDGALKAPSANLFLINPNGIVFGPSAVIDIGGSFLATTASSINFADGKKFSATETQATPTLSVSIPIGLQFGATAAPIRNQSQASPGDATNTFGLPVGLQVKPGRTLALVGGEITLEGGNLRAESGRIELGSVGSNSLVRLNPINQGWVLGYEGIPNFQNIKLIKRTLEGVESSSQIDVSGIGGGNIQLQGQIVEIIGDLVRVRNRNNGIGDGGETKISARQLIIRDGAQVLSSTRGSGSGGSLIVNASELVELSGNVNTNDNRNFPSVLSSVTTFIGSNRFEGKAGDVTINTKRLIIRDGAEVSTESSGLLRNPQEFLPATGKGGNLTVNASESIELMGRTADGLPSGLLARTLGSGNAGRIAINTGKLIVRDGAALTVSSQLPRLRPNVVYQENPNNLGAAGEINVNARSIILDNKGQITSNSLTGQGGNISLNVRDVLLLRRNSQISTNAGTANAPGNGGNITINAPNGFIVATPQGNNDITANAFSGAGGRIIINANNIFGFVPRTRADLVQLLGTEDSQQLNPNRLPTSDITAFSQQNPSLNGTIQINTPDVDPSRGLLELPAEPFDASRQIATYCKPGGKFKRGSLIATGKGGIAPSPTDPLMDDSVLVNWITLDGESENSVSYTPHHISKRELDSVTLETQIVPAQGWVQDGKGNVTLVAQAPTVTPHSPLLNSVACAANL